jgi:hypothetical protein
MLTPPVPEAFDWVKARAKCSLRHLLTVLAEAVNADLDSARKLEMRDVNLTPSWPSENKFMVSRIDYLSDGEKSRSVVFELMKGEIKVRHATPEQTLIMSVTPALTAECKCMFEIKGKTGLFYAWQISRSALEELIFN